MTSLPHHLMGRDLLTASDLNVNEIEFLFGIARIFSTSLQAGLSIPLLKGKTIVNLFFEESTRTRLSFEQAIRKLEGTSLNFSASHSSLSKGESAIDTAQNIEAMNPHALIVRHSSSGSSKILSDFVKIPVINAGDGFHEHPTQALLDVFTIIEKKEHIKGKNILILGDIAHSRVARSNIHFLNMLGANIFVSGPPTLMPPRLDVLKVTYVPFPENILSKIDVVMALRIQKERHDNLQFPSISEYSKFWGLNQSRSKLLQKNAIILHPGPINRGVELDPEVADGPHSVILDQVKNGILIRMALLSSICNANGLQMWLKNEGHNV